MALTKISSGLVKSGVALSNLGYTPVNKAGDTMTGGLTLTDSSTAVTANRFITPVNYGGDGLYNGYVGQLFNDGCAAVYNLGTIGSSASTNASVNWVNVYTSGHWGEYTKIIVYEINTYYNPGFAKWYVDGTTVTQLRAYGATGSVSSSQTTVGTATHSGQNVYRYNLTFNNPGTYQGSRWLVGVMAGGGTQGHLSSVYSQTQADNFYKVSGGGVHFLNLSAAQMSASPMYRASI